MHLFHNFVLYLFRLLFECLNSRLRMNNNTRHDNLLSDDFLYYISGNILIFFIEIDVFRIDLYCFFIHITINVSLL